MTPSGSCFFSLSCAPASERAAFIWWLDVRWSVKESHKSHGRAVKAAAASAVCENDPVSASGASYVTKKHTCEDDLSSTSLRWTIRMLFKLCKSPETRVQYFFFTLKKANYLKTWSVNCYFTPLIKNIDQNHSSDTWIISFSSAPDGITSLTLNFLPVLWSDRTNLVLTNRFSHNSDECAAVDGFIMVISQRTGGVSILWTCDSPPSSLQGHWADG